MPGTNHIDNTHDTQSEYTVADVASSSLSTLSAMSVPPLSEDKYLTITKDPITLLRATRILNPQVNIYLV